MIGLDHRSRADMAYLAHTLRLVPEPFHPTVAAAIFANDLMRPQWWMRLIVWARCRGDAVKRFGVWRAVLARHTDIASPLIAATAEHIENGRDRVDPESVGGFNAGEVDTMCGILAALAEGLRS